MKNKHIGSSLNDFLAEENLLIDCELSAFERLCSLKNKDTATKEHLFKEDND